MDLEAIEAFLQEMRERHQEEIDSVMLPEGVDEYVGQRIAAGDSETILFMLRLGYLMGLNTGYAIAESGQELSEGLSGGGPLQA